MPKDPTKNVDRYKIRGGHLNAFEFHQNQGTVSQQQHESGGHLNGPADGTDLPPDRAKAERTRQLLAEHGEIMPEPMERAEEAQLEGDNMAAKVKADSQREDDEMKNSDFAPTHGRSPEVIREMIQSRRATDEVPDPEDIAAGRQKTSRQKKEHGITGERTGSRSATVRRSSSQSTRRSSTATASQRGGEPAKGTRSTGDAAGSRGKQAALRDSTNRTIKTTTAKAGGQSTKASTAKAAGKSAPSRKGSAQAAAQKNEKSARKRSASQNGKQSTKRASSQGGGKQNATRTTGKQSATRTGANQKSAPSRKMANGKTAHPANKTGRAAASKTRTSAKTQVKASKTSGGKGR
jgi:hypothetical protein